MIAYKWTSSKQITFNSSPEYKTTILFLGINNLESRPRAVNEPSWALSSSSLARPKTLARASKQAKNFSSSSAQILMSRALNELNFYWMNGAPLGSFSTSKARVLLGSFTTLWPSPSSNGGAFSIHGRGRGLKFELMSCNLWTIHTLTVYCGKKKKGTALKSQPRLEHLHGWNQIVKSQIWPEKWLTV